MTTAHIFFVVGLIGYITTIIGSYTMSYLFIKIPSLNNFTSKEEYDRMVTWLGKVIFAIAIINVAFALMVLISIPFVLFTL